MSVVLIVLGITYIHEVAIAEIVLILVYIMLFEFSLGPIVWIYMSETMTDKGTSIGTLINLVLTLVMGIATPFLIDAIGGVLFIIFGAFCAAVTIFMTLLTSIFIGCFLQFDYCEGD